MIYLHQRCYVKWDQVRSYSFHVTNGTRQGTIFSHKGGFGCYLDPLLQLLRESGYGCRIGLHWFGALAYADNIILLSPTINGLQEMVKVCEVHAQETDLMFSSDPDPVKSKTMCIAFNCPNKENLESITLDVNSLPWKSFAKHIGNILHENGTMEKDMQTKRARFIDVCQNLNTEFDSLPVECQMKILRIHISLDHVCGTLNLKVFKRFVIVGTLILK